MKVLITGGAGFIGSHTTEVLLQKGFEVVVVDHLKTVKREFLSPRVKLYSTDITSPALAEVFAKERPDAVIHLAAQIDVAASLADPTADAETNILGSIRLMMCCRQFQVKKVVYASSCAVYGKNSSLNEMTPINEKTPISPISFYGASKYAPEMYFRMFHAEFGLPFTILRYANVFGPRQGHHGERGVIFQFIRKIKDGESPTIYGDGEQSRDFVFVKDVAAANVLALTHADNEICNIGTGIQTTINDLYRYISRALNFHFPPVYQAPRKGDIRHSTLDSRKALRQLGWHANYDLQLGLQDTIREMDRDLIEGV